MCIGLLFHCNVTVLDGSPVFTGDLSTLAAVKQKSSVGTRAAAAKPVVSTPNLLVNLPGGKNPVSLLHELYSGSDLTFDDDMLPETPGIFVAKVHIENRDFQVPYIRHSAIASGICRLCSVLDKVVYH